ncbi:MAG: 23S rRNA (guanosine(2251)-2'-O)-methyltransferase RlmB [Mycoplasmatales bacterium]
MEKNLKVTEKKKKHYKVEKQVTSNEEAVEVFYGKNTVEELIRTKTVEKVYLANTERKDKVLQDLIKEKNIPVVYVDRFKLGKLAGTENHQGVVAVASAAEYVSVEEMILKTDISTNPMFIMLDEVQDPHNLGAILRVCDAFQMNGVIFNKRRSVQLNQTVAKVSTGAINHVDVARVTNLKHAIEDFKKAGYWIAYLDMDGKQTTRDFDYNMPLVVIVGGEDKGVTQIMKKYCDFGINIPMKGHVNSLNVSCSVSVLAYEKSIFK